MIVFIKYYDQNKKEFKLSFNIFKGRYIVLDKSAPDLDVVYNLYNSKEIDDLLKLEDYCNQFSKNYSLNSWDNFLITLPFSKCCYVWDDPIYITEDLDNKNLESYKNLIQNKINKCIINAKKKI